MSKTVKSVYKFHDKNDDNAVSDESPESLEMNRDEKRSKHSLEKPSKVYKIVNKICRPVKARYARAKDNFLLDPSNTWRENSNGLLTCPKQPKYILFLGVCCPCIIHGINASDIMTGEEGKFEKDPDTGKWVGARFVIIQALICCGGPCCCITSPAAGGAVREQIFAQSLEAGKEDVRRIHYFIPTYLNCISNNYIKYLYAACIYLYHSLVL